jgi:hypothetical protein
LTNGTSHFCLFIEVENRSQTLRRSRSKLMPHGHRIWCQWVASPPYSVRVQTANRGSGQISLQCSLETHFRIRLDIHVHRRIQILARAGRFERISTWLNLTFDISSFAAHSKQVLEANVVWLQFLIGDTPVLNSQVWIQDLFAVSLLDVRLVVNVCSLKTPSLTIPVGPASPKPVPCRNVIASRVTSCIMPLRIEYFGSSIPCLSIRS